MNNFNKKYFIGSFLLHVSLFLFIFYITTDNQINKRFVVLGLHSKKPTHAYFKPIKTPTTSASQWLSHRNIQQKKAPTKTVAEKAVVKKTPIKKAIIKKQTEKKTQPTTLKQNLEKKPAKKTQSPPEDKKLKIEDKIIEQPKENQKIDEPEKFESKDEELHFNLMGESDPNLIKYQLSIQKEVERLWHPPVGVAKGTECSICFVVNSKGNVENFEFTKRSKILIYDLSVSKIAKSFQFDRSLWNKKFTIDFRQ